MKKIYFDTNQFYYIRRSADEAEGWDYGDYRWAYRMFPNSPEIVQDVRALCYIVALQYEWDLDFSASNASYSEICLSRSRRAQATRDAWEVFAEDHNKDEHLKQLPFLPDFPVEGLLCFDFIDDPDDRVILRHFAQEGAGVLLTSDDDILKHKNRLEEMNLLVMRPSEWLNTFVHTSDGEDQVFQGTYGASQLGIQGFASL